MAEHNDSGSYLVKIFLNLVFFYILFRFSAINFAGNLSILNVALTLSFVTLGEHLFNAIYDLNPMDDMFGNRIFWNYPVHTYLFLLTAQMIGTSLILGSTIGLLGLFVVTNWYVFLVATAILILVRTIALVIFMWTNMQETTPVFR